MLVSASGFARIASFQKTPLYLTQHLTVGGNMNQALADLQNAIVQLGQLSGWSILALITAAGTISMAIVQLIKELTPIRRAFQRQWLRRWFEMRARRLRLHKGTDRKLARPDPYEGFRMLIELAIGGDADSFFDLAAEQLVAQMNAAALAALDYPKRHRDLLLVLSEGADLKDVARVMVGVSGPSSQPYHDARNRVGNRIQRNLDGVQIALGNRWRLYMQSLAIALTVILIEAAVLWNAREFHLPTFFLAIVIGVIGGYLAPVARDLVAALQSLRKV